MQTTHTPLPPQTAPVGTCVAIVRSSYYDELIQEMEKSARHVLSQAGVRTVVSVIVPGAFEIPFACTKVIKEKKVSGVIALGIIVQGETHHASEIARACTDGIMQVQLEYSVPIIHEVLFVDSLEQAKARVMGEGNKGSEAATTLLRMMSLEMR
jgi:6,7-dimethyl-8-ribityllumazine synthase